MSPAEAIDAAFAVARAESRAALMPYMMGGYPDLVTSAAIAHAYADGGADLVELGIPYSDPLADGSVIHAAGTAALRAGARQADVLAIGAELATRVPVVAMCYFNPIHARGVARFLDELAERRISGLIVPDLPLDEAEDVRAACDVRGLALVPLAAPTTPEERLARIGAHARGFLYTVSVTGTTGERSAVQSGLDGLLARAHAATEVPVAVGFGIAAPEQAAQAAQAGADGVIVGTRLVRAAGEGEDITSLVRSFAEALQAPAVR